MPQNKAGSKPAGDAGSESDVDAPAIDPTQGTGGGKPESFQEFLKAQSGEVQTLYAADVKGLKNSLKAAREERDALQERIEAITKTLPDTEKAKKEFERLSEDFKAAQQRIEFLESAVDPQVECLNPAAAWIIANTNKLFRSTGQPDWGEIRKAAPQLFGKPAEDIDAGSGTNGGGPPKTKSDMNAWIRNAAGIQT